MHATTIQKIVYDLQWITNKKMYAEQQAFNRLLNSVTC